ncbi:hypothetical protein ACVBE9_00340 [Eionea flava]
MTLRLVSNERPALHEESAINFLSDFKSSVMSGEIRSFAVVGIAQDDSFSIKKSIQPEDQIDMVEVLEHLKILLNIDINQ